MSRLFGTDGIRGSATSDLHSGLVRRVGLALAAAAAEGSLGAHSAGGGPPTVVVGRDTRPSGPRIEHDLVEGLSSVGTEVVCGGVLPTAAVAHLVSVTGADAGVVVSASHNPPGDNGLKLFGPGGWKLDAAAEGRIEELVASPPPETAAESGAIRHLPDAVSLYVDHLVSSVSGDLSGMRVVVDCAEGAASVCAPQALGRLGVEVVELNSKGDGSRINEGSGALHPEVICRAAREHDAVGITFDGDADRVLLSDEDGGLVDGDAIIALLAQRMRAQRTLSGDGVVVTVMANQALRRWCAEQGIRVLETPVGDRNVLAAMRRHHLALGGEQSGHVLRLDRSTTGDGILVALGVLEAVAARRGRLREMVPFRPFPQVLVNVPVTERDGVADSPAVLRAVAAAEQELAGAGRVLVRPSGTEPLVRVMVEATDEQVAAGLAERVAAAVTEAGSD